MIDIVDDRATSDLTDHTGVIDSKCMVHYGVYALFLKENKGCKLSYGRTKYDFDEMTVTSFAPGQQLLNNQTLSIAQVADRLGFGYPQHFVRFFKRKTGKTPTEYRAA